MTVVKDTDLISLLEKSLQQDQQSTLEEIGTVVKVCDNVCKIYGLTNAVFGEYISFENGSHGIVLDIDEDIISVILTENTVLVKEGETALRGTNVFCVPVGPQLLGRVISATGRPNDELGPIATETYLPVEQQAPGIMYRIPINEPLETGIIAIDSLIPIGKGQRELIIGNRNTGKTSICIDIILHQKGKDIICIYVSIGHKRSHTAKIIHELVLNGADAYTIIVEANANEPALNQFLAPYTGCTIGEYFMSKGKNVLIIYDDLSNHAIAYRELSLLLRRPPGREAYPGDIFYIHSRLLERAGRMNEAYGGGSLTAIPITQTQGDDISAYIQTNLISITDGQIFLDTTLFNKGIRPAINIGLSVSRVGGVAQTKATKKVAGPLKLELAQYQELLAFEQFGSELDKASQRCLDRGRRATELLKQTERETYSFVDQALFLFLLKEKYLDKLVLAQVCTFAKQYASYVKNVYHDVYKKIEISQDLGCDDLQMLITIANEFLILFLPTDLEE